VKTVGKIAAVVAAAASLTLLLMFLAGFFHRKVVADQVKASVHDPSNVTLAAVRLIQKPRYETAVGTIKAVHEASVASRLLARVVEVNVKAGQAVQPDDILLALMTRTFRLVTNKRRPCGKARRQCWKMPALSMSVPSNC
jgi:multidrug efflux pump subunit AcrA (membrane-fusion protein)